MTDQIQEAIKEGLRIVVIAIIPVLIPMIQNEAWDVKSILIVAVIAVLRALDKFLHERGKDTNDLNMTKGLTRF